MSREAARLGLVTAVTDLQATFYRPLVVELPNQTVVDPEGQSEPFLKVRIAYHNSFQASLGSTKHLRAIGHLVLEAWVQIGTGTQAANVLLEHFFKPLHMSDTIPGVRTEAADFVDSYQKTGWEVHPVLVPFWYDDYN